MQMSKNRKPDFCKKFVFFLSNFILLGISLFLQACNTPVNPTKEQLGKMTESANQQTAVAIPTEFIASVTPVPDQKKIIVARIPDANQGIFEIFRTGLQQLPAEIYTIEETDNLTPAAVPEDADLIIFPNLPPDLTQYTQQFPQKQFVVLSLQPQTDPNVWTIQYDIGFQPFLAGYFVGVTANDWRGAGLLPSDSPLYGTTIAETFTNGMKLFCGRCQSYGPPYVEFPLTVLMPMNSAPEAWIAALDQIQDSFPNTFYVSEAALNLPLLQKLSEKQAAVITAEKPPEGWDGNWLGSVQINLAGALHDIVLRSANGQPAEAVIPELQIETGIQQSLFNQGKKLYLDKLYADLISGLVSPYDPVPPASFEK